MYGNNIFVVKPDEQKENARTAYINSLPEQMTANNAKSANNKSLVKLILLYLASYFVFIPIIALITIWFVFSKAYYGFILVGILIAGFTAYAIAVFVKIIQKSKFNKAQEIVTAEFHESKLLYYANANVIGYSVLDHVTRDDNGSYYYYAYYEIDRRNIQSIYYDSYYAEYVLNLHHPVFIDYRFEKSNRFYIADIFDDNVLSNMLCCDLPPKNMNF